MPWYGWLPWILFVIVTAAFVIYLIVNRRKTPAELRDALAKMDSDYNAMKTELVREKLARQRAEKEKAAKELELLEFQHSERLKGLKEKEQEEYERLKSDPQSGIDYINDLLNDKSG